MAELVQVHVTHMPFATLMHSSDFGKLDMTLPSVTALAATLLAGLLGCAPLHPPRIPPGSGTRLSR